jgi:hypothetical protein
MIGPPPPPLLLLLTIIINSSKYGDVQIFEDDKTDTVYTHKEVKSRLFSANVGLCNLLHGNRLIRGHIDRSISSKRQLRHGWLGSRLRTHL